MTTQNLIQIVNDVTRHHHQNEDHLFMNVLLNLELNYGMSKKESAKAFQLYMDYLSDKWEKLSKRANFNEQKQ